MKLPKVIIIFVVLAGALLIMNLWISRSVREAVVPQKSEAKSGSADQPRLQEVFLESVIEMPDVDAPASPVYSEPEKMEREQGKKEIIYEIPLEDVILVQ